MSSFRGIVDHFLMNGSTISESKTTESSPPKSSSQSSFAPNITIDITDNIDNNPSPSASTTKSASYTVYTPWGLDEPIQKEVRPATPPSNIAHVLNRLGDRPSSPTPTIQFGSQRLPNTNPTKAQESIGTSYADGYSETIAIFEDYEDDEDEDENDEEEAQMVFDGSDIDIHPPQTAPTPTSIPPNNNCIAKVALIICCCAILITLLVILVDVAVVNAGNIHGYNGTHESWCCNVGDSQCILIDEQHEKVTQLPIEHTLDYPLEKQRIESAKGWVTFGRDCCIFAVSRSLGDKDFKHEIENLVISRSDVTYDKCRILACDGLFDSFTNEQCLNVWLIKNKTNQHDDIIHEVADELCHGDNGIEIQFDCCKTFPDQLDNEKDPDIGAIERNGDIVTDGYTATIRSTIENNDYELNCVRQPPIKGIKSNDDKYIILACDGLFDVFTNEQCMNWLIKNTTNQHDDIIQEVADKLCHDSIYVRKTKDNVSIIIIRIDYNEIEIDLMENDENDFDGQEAMIMDEIKDEKIYNSTSSNGSGQSSLLISQNEHENINDSLQSHLSNGSNASQGDDTTTTTITTTENNNKPIKHKFHVVMASDDALTDNIIENNNDKQDDQDYIASK